MLKKADPGNRNWKLAHVAVQQLLAECETDSKVADLNRMLAFRTLKQMSVDSAGDLRFLTQLYTRQGQGKEVLQVFDTLKSQDTSVGKQAFNDWQFARQRIDLCVAESKWEDLYSLCKSLLGDGAGDAVEDDTGSALKVRDDWKVWSGLVQACDKLQKLDDFPAQNDDSECTWKEKRQVALATLWIALLSEQKEVDKPSFTRTIQLSKDYITTWQKYPFCYDDIKDFVAQLPSDGQAEIRQHISGSSQKLSNADVAEEDSKKKSELLTAEINALKFEYLLSFGMVETPDLEAIRAFACNCVRLQDLCHQKKLRTADACYLAVAALIRLYEIEKDVTYLFQAAYLLEMGPAPEDAHPGKVMLVYIESEIGLHSLAMKQYKSLRVREIQQETMAHMLLSRISISHPFALEQKRQETIDPSRIIDEALDVFITSDQKLATYQGRLFEKGQCDLIFELQDLRSTLSNSMTRRMLVLEQARIARLTDDYPEPRIYDIRPRVFEHWISNLKDSRDYAETFNYDGVTKDNFPERRLQAGGKIPGSKWLAMSILAEDVWALLQNRDTVCTVPSKPITLSEADAAELLPMESALVPAWNLLLQTTQLLLATEKPNSQDELPSHITALQKELSALPLTTLLSHKSPPSAPSGLPPPSSTLRNHFLALDLLHTVSFLLTTAAAIATKKRRGQLIPPPALLPLRNTVKAVCTAVRKSADAARAAVDARDIVQALRHGGVGDVLSEAEVLGKGIRGFADRAEGSARDAWEGVLKVRNVGL